MSTARDLPQELLSFLEQRRPQSLLVRGPPGAGKTTLALALVEAFRGKKMYASCRVPHDELHEQFPWLGSSANDSVEVIDASEVLGGMQRTARAMRKVSELVQGPGGQHGVEGLWLPDPLLDAWAKASTDQRTIIALDSWDALVEAYLTGSGENDRTLPDRHDLERIALSLLARGSATMVFITERNEPTQLDYLVNGVVDVQVEQFDDRMERWVYLTKLRGVRILNQRYPFTLEGSRFTCITPVHWEFRARLAPPDPEPEPQPASLWPGSREFAEYFGRLPLNRIMLWEVDDGVPHQAILQLYAPILSQVIRGGGRIFHLLPFGIPPEEVWEMYRSAVSPEQFRDQVRIQTAVYPRPRSPVPDTVIAPVRSGEVTGPGPRNPEAHRFIREGGRPGSANLMLIWTAGLRAHNRGEPPPYTPDELPAIASAYIGEAPVHQIYIGPPDDPFIGSLRPMAAIQIRMRSRRGRVFLYGENPVTPLLVLVLEGSGSNSFRLLPMV